MMKIKYIFREGIVGIRRARMPFMISVFSVMIALLMVGIGVLAVDNGLKYIGNLQSEYDLEVFVDQSADIVASRAIADIIKGHPGVIRMDYLSKEDAAKLYNEEFEDDVLSLLDDNPLPSSFRVSFEDDYRTSTYIQSFVKTMETTRNVDEVMFKKDLFERIQGLLQLIYIVAAGGLFLIILSTVFLTANNLRLMILSRYEFIETVRLLGASDFLVKAPFFLEGGILGFLGALFAILDIMLIEYVLEYFHIIALPVRIAHHPEVAVGLLIFGVSLASLGVLKAVRRMLRFVA